MRVVSIPGFNDEYQIDESGRVFAKAKEWNCGNRGSTRRLPGRELLVYLDDTGYKAVALNGRRHRLHRLLAIAFEVPGTGNVINHKDGVKTNNSLDNLEWCTQKHNVREAWRLGLSKPMLGVNHPQAKNTEVSVLKMREMYAGGSKREEIAEHFNQPLGTVCDIIYRKTWRHI